MLAPAGGSLAQPPVHGEVSAPPTAATTADAATADSDVTAQSSAPGSSLERQFIKNVLRDQAVIWTAPFRLKRGDAWALVPLGVGAAALIASDRHTSGLIDKDGSLQPISNNFSRMGAGYITFGTAAAFYLIGRRTGNERARETGLLAAEALADGAIVSGVLKAITQRPRPSEGDGRGRFFTGGTSFPSGHSVEAWALATVVAKEYGGDHPLVGVAVYGLAAMTGLARYSGRRHFLSDVLIGSAVGFGIGRYVYKQHHDPALSAGRRKRVTSALVPAIAPRYNPGARLYGAALTWGR